MIGAILGGAQLVGSLLGGAGKGAAAERDAANRFQQNENQRLSQDYSTEQSAVVNLLQLLESAQRDRADRQLTSGKERARQSLLGSLMANYQPMSISGLPSNVVMPQTSGGMGSAINPLARAGGNQLQKSALLAMLTGSDVPSLPDTASARLAKPTYGGYKQPGKMETIGSIGGLVGGLAGGLGGLLKKPPTPTQASSGVGSNRNPYAGLFGG